MIGTKRTDIEAPHVWGRKNGNSPEPCSYLSDDPGPLDISEIHHAKNAKHANPGRQPTTHQVLSTRCRLPFLAERARRYNPAASGTVCSVASTGSTGVSAHHGSRRTAQSTPLHAPIETRRVHTAPPKNADTQSGLIAASSPSTSRKSLGVRMGCVPCRWRSEDRRIHRNFDATPYDAHALVRIRVSVVGGSRSRLGRIAGGGLLSSCLLVGKRPTLNRGQ